MANMLQDRPASSSGPEPEPVAAGTHSESYPQTPSAVAPAVPVRPTKRKRHVYWTPRPGDVPALSVLVGLTAVGLIVLSLVIALVGVNAPGNRGSAASSGSNGTMALPPHA